MRFFQPWHSLLSKRMTFNHSNNMILIIINVSHLSTEFCNKSTASVPWLFFYVCFSLGTSAVCLIPWMLLLLLIKYTMTQVYVCMCFRYSISFFKHSLFHPNKLPTHEPVVGSFSICFIIAAFSLFLLTLPHSAFSIWARALRIPASATMVQFKEI